VLLVLHRRGIDLPDIMDAFWPDATMRRAAERLSTEAADLRRHLRHAAGDRHVQPVINTGGRYHLNPDLVDVDLWTFTDELHAATTSSDPATHLRRAVDRHTGPLADGLDADWLTPHREHYRRLAVRARLRLADLLTDTDPTLAADLATAAAAADPHNDATTRHGMHAATRIGDQPRAAALFSRLVIALRDIDTEPAAETLALARHLGIPTTDHQETQAA
jgi:DNA-binding SARP family transcriptional activator